MRPLQAIKIINETAINIKTNLSDMPLNDDDHNGPAETIEDAPEAVKQPPSTATILTDRKKVFLEVGRFLF